MPAAGSENSLTTRAGQMCRTVAVAIIAGFRRKMSFDEHEARFVTRPAKEQFWITAAVLAGLFACSVFAAQFGLIGLALFWLGVIVLIR